MKMKQKTYNRMIRIYGEEGTQNIVDAADKAVYEPENSITDCAEIFSVPTVEVRKIIMIANRENSRPKNVFRSFGDPQNFYQPCPYCNKIPPKNFDDVDTCYGAYQRQPKEYRVEVIDDTPQEETIAYEDGFKCGGQARDWVNYFYPNNDWQIG